MPETPALEDDISVQGERRGLLERLGFPEGVRPLRESLFVCVLVAPLLAGIYKLWHAHWRVPWSYSGDGLQSAAYAKAIVENGWYLYNPRLAAPFQADWRDFPLGGENVHWVALKLLGYATGNYALAMNLYFLLGFFAIALVAHFVARYLGFSLPTAIVIAIAYAFAPYHGFRNVAHLLRSNYYAVPLGVLVIVWLANYGTDFFRAADGSRRWRRGRLLTAILFCVIMGASDTQNSAFLVSILVVIGLVVAVRDRQWRPIALVAILGAATFGSLLLNDVPFVMARVQRGNNQLVANRPLTDQDQYALRPVELILPSPGHRIKALRDLYDTADDAKAVSGETPGTPLGTLGAIGLVFSIGAALAFGLGRRSRAPDQPSPARLVVDRVSQFAGQLGTITLAAILIGTIGGFAFLIALAGFTSYRTWNRISIFIAFAALLATGLLLELLFRFLRRRWPAKHTLVTVAMTAIVVVLCVGAALDQITPRDTFSQNATALRFSIDDAFYKRLEASVPKGVMMFQLPFEPFPEVGTIGNMTDYQDFSGYLHTKHLRWNYGGMKGRPEGDWPKNFSLDDPVAALADIAAAGFQGVVVDRTGFLDNAHDFLTAAQPYVGDPQLRSSDNRLLYLDLTGLRARLQHDLGADAVAQSGRIVTETAIQWTGFDTPEQRCNGTLRWAIDKPAYLTFDNTTGKPLTITPTTQFLANPAAERITVHGPGYDEDVLLRDGKANWQPTITLPTGTSKISFTLVGPNYVATGDPRTLEFAMINYRFAPQFDSAVEAWAHQLSPTGCGNS